MEKSAYTLTKYNFNSSRADTISPQVVYRILTDAFSDTGDNGLRYKDLVVSFKYLFVKNTKIPIRDNKTKEFITFMKEVSWISQEQNRGEYYLSEYSKPEINMPLFPNRPSKNGSRKTRDNSIIRDFSQDKASNTRLIIIFSWLTIMTFMILLFLKH